VSGVESEGGTAAVGDGGKQAGAVEPVRR
jgi:hypothetical protein